MAQSKSKRDPKRVILVIDDDREMIRLLKKVLEREGYIVETAVNGVQGLLLVREKTYDLVITDLKMPGMSGLELMQRVRSILPDQKIILITAYSDVNNYIHAMGSGAFEFMNKPIKMRDLKVVVHKAFKNEKIKQEVF